MPKRRLTILGSSTRQWNPGDEFIMRGVRNLLHPLLDSNWLLWNRNPDLFVDAWANTHHRQPLIGNYVSSLSTSMIDAVVFCGSPEWLGHPVEPIYDYLDSKPDVPLIAIGVGSGIPTVALSETERRVLERHTSLIITRSTELAQALNQILQNNKAIPLPCPSIFCNQPDASAGVPPASLGLICQTPETNLHSKAEDFFERIVDEVEGTDLPTEIIAFYSGEYPALAGRFGTDRVRYEIDSWNYLSRFGGYRSIISTRLHGAIAAAVTGTPAILIAEDDFRIESTARLLDPILPYLTVEAAFRSAEHLSPLSVRNHRQRVLDFQGAQRRRYEAELRPFLEKALDIT